MEPTSIYDYLYNLIIKAKDPKFFLSSGLGAAFTDWIEDDISQYKYLKNKSQEEITAVALDYPNDFDVYLCRHGYYWDRTYIICKHNLSPIQIYKCLDIDESMSFNRFTYDTFRVDSEGDASETSLAKEMNMPRYMIFENEKVSYYLDEADSKVSYYRTLYGTNIAYEDLDNFQIQNHGFLEGKEIRDIQSHFNVTPEEAEDILINYYNKGKLTEAKQIKKLKIMEDTKEELFFMTPYMLRNDGELLTCGDLHPYIKMSNSASFETNLNTLNSHPEFLDWFYDNTLNEEVRTLITEYKECKDDEKEELMNLLNDLTNQEFCRVRTSNYKVKYGGDNGQIYFRISSVGFNWFDLIWNVVNKFSKDIKEVTVIKDKQTFGGKEFDYYYNHLPTDEFLTLKGNPIIESIDSNTKDNLVNEDIEKHDTLNPELFEHNELKKEVKETIENIADLFIEELSEQDIKFKLKDIILLGSNVSYNYTKDSDLDVHLIADSKNLKCPDDLYPLLYGAYVSIFNKNYDITIKGIPVELYVEIDESTAKSNGIYSLTKGWIKEPVQTDIPDIDFDQFNVEFKTWEDRYLDIINNKSPENENKSEIIKDFISDLYDLRKQSITKDGEYGLGNLIFKEFRNKGYLDYLKDQRKVEKGKELSLESLQEDIDTDKLSQTIKQLSAAGVDWEIESSLDDEYTENIIILNDMEYTARDIIESIYGDCYVRLFDLDRKLPYFRVMN